MAASGAYPCSTLGGGGGGVGGIIPHFYRLFGILKFGGGGYSGFAHFLSLNYFENMGYIQSLTKIYFNN